MEVENPSEGRKLSTGSRENVRLRNHQCHRCVSRPAALDNRKMVQKQHWNNDGAQEGKAKNYLSVLRS